MFQSSTVGRIVTRKLDPSLVPRLVESLGIREAILDSGLMTYGLIVS